MGVRPASAEGEALRLTVCGAPGVRVSVAGVAVTPAGRPVTVTATVPAKPLTADASSVTGVPVVPSRMVWLAGDTASEKSGGGGGAGATERAITAVWARAPERPVTVTVLLAATALDAAVSVMACAAPGVRESVVELAVTPDGSPASVTITGALKPLRGLARTLICAVLPAVMPSVAGVAVKLKSPLDLPHPIKLPRSAPPSRTMTSTTAGLESMGAEFFRSVIREPSPTLPLRVSITVDTRRFRERGSRKNAPFTKVRRLAGC